MKNTTLRARVAAMFAGLFASGVEMSAEDRQALEAAEAAVRQEGDVVATVARSVAPEATEPTASEPTDATAETHPEPGANAELAALQEQIAALQAQVSAQTADQMIAQIHQWSDAGYVTPAAASFAQTMLQSHDPAIREAFQSFVTSNGVHVAFQGNDAEATTVPAAQAAAVLAESNDASNGTLHSLAIAKIKASKGDEKDFRVYQAALNAVAKENPSLVEANREAVPSL